MNLNLALKRRDATYVHINEHLTFLEDSLFVDVDVYSANNPCLPIVYLNEHV